MCDAKNKLLDLMLPYIDEYNKDEEELKTKEQKLYSLNNLLSLVDKDYLKYLEYDNDELLKEMLDGYNGDITKYNACKYILSAPYEEIKTSPQYLDAVKYIEGLYNYTRAYYDDYVLEYQEVYKKHQINVLINKGKVVALVTPKDIEEQTHTTNIRDAFFVLIGGVHSEME